jgi:hypothetical protein
MELLNNNKYLWGTCMLFLNMGSRFIAADLGTFHEKVLSQNIVKKFILFCLFFVATRDVAAALVLTIGFSVIIYGVFNDKSKYTLIPKQQESVETLKKYYGL